MARAGAQLVGRDQMQDVRRSRLDGDAIWAAPGHWSATRDGGRDLEHGHELGTRQAHGSRPLASRYSRHPHPSATAIGIPHIPSQSTGSHLRRPRAGNSECRQHMRCSRRPSDLEPPLPLPTPVARLFISGWAPGEQLERRRRVRGRPVCCVRAPRCRVSGSVVCEPSAGGAVLVRFHHSQHLPSQSGFLASAQPLPASFSTTSRRCRGIEKTLEFTVLCCQCRWCVVRNLLVFVVAAFLLKIRSFHVFTPVKIKPRAASAIAPDLHPMKPQQPGEANAIHATNQAALGLRIPLIRSRSH